MRRGFVASIDGTTDDSVVVRGLNAPSGHGDCTGGDVLFASARGRVDQLREWEAEQETPSNYFVGIDFGTVSIAGEERAVAAVAVGNTNWTVVVPSGGVPVAADVPSSPT